MRFEVHAILEKLPHQFLLRSYGLFTTPNQDNFQTIS